MKGGKLQCLLLAAAGGIAEAYSLMRLNGVFSNVQTGNLLLGALALVHGNWKWALLYGVSVAAYIVGIMLCRMINQRKWEPVSLILSEAALVAAAITSERCAVAAVFLLALLCGFYFEVVCSEMEKQKVPSPKLKYGMILCFGIGSSAGALLIPVAGSYAVAAVGIMLILSFLPEWIRSKQNA